MHFKVGNLYNEHAIYSEQEKAIHSPPTHLDHWIQDCSTQEVRTCSTVMIMAIVNPQEYEELW